MHTLNDYTRELDREDSVRAFVHHWKALATGHPSDELAQLEQSRPAIARRVKALVEAFNTLNTAELRRAQVAFLPFLKTKTLLGQMSVLNLPPYTAIPDVTTEPVATFVQEGAPAAFVKWDFQRTTIEPATIRFLFALTDEVVQSDERVLPYLESLTARVVAQAENRLLLDDQPAVAHVRPAGLTNGVTPSGFTWATAAADLAALVGALSGGRPDRPYLVVSQANAVALSAVPGLMVNNSVSGMPVLTTAAAGTRLLAIDAGYLVQSDDGLRIEPSRTATAWMDSVPPGTTPLVSAFGTDLVIMRVLRFLSWLKLRADAVQFCELTAV